MSEYLYPVRRNRRDFLAAAGAMAATVGLGGLSSAREAEETVLGEGSCRFRLDNAWGKLPAGKKYGLGCAIVVDSQDRVIVTSRSNDPCVAIFDKTGKLVETWAKDFATKIGYDTTGQVSATAHGLYLSNEGGTDFLYWTENVAKQGDKRTGARVYKTDMQGKVLYTLGNVAED